MEIKNKINKLERPKKLINTKPAARKGDELKGTIGGYRPGAGMPRGKKIQRTIEKERALKEYQQKIIQQAHKLFNAQSVLAFGSYYIYLVEHTEDADGKVKSRKILVEDPEAIENILNDPEMVQGDNYFIINQVPPNEYTINAMLDRAFGKPIQQNINENLNTEIKITKTIKKK